MTSLLPFGNFSLNLFEPEVRVMSNMLGIVIGVVVVIVGVILLITWWPMFIKGLMATLPILLILIGAGVLLYFFSEMKSKLDVGKEDTPSESK